MKKFVNNNSVSFKEKCFCNKECAPFGAIQLTEKQMVDLCLYKKSIEAKFRGEVDYDFYFKIRFCPFCGKKLKGKMEEKYARY